MKFTRSLFKPVVLALGRFRISLQLALVAIPLVAAILLLFGNYRQDVNSTIDLANQERSGVAFARTLLPLVRFAEELRMGQKTDFGPALADAQAEQERSNAELSTADGWAQVRTAVQANDPVTLSGALQALLSQISDKSNLTLDPDLDSYYVMDAAIWRLPELEEAIGQLAVADARSLPVAAHEVKRLYENAVSDLGTAIKASPSLAPELGHLLENFRAVEQLSAAAVSGPVDRAVATAALAATHALWLASVESLDRLLVARIAGTESTFTGKMAITLSTLLLSAYLLVGVAVTLRRNLSSAIDVADAITHAKLDVVSSPETRDECGDVLKALEVMRTQLLQRNEADRQTTEAIARSNADFGGQIAAIGKAQAVAQFTLDGKIVQVNDRFLEATGHSAVELTGQHHGVLVDAAHRGSAEYRAFWEQLNRGEAQAGQYRRVGKDGREVWMQALYSPILDEHGKPFKIMMYATDVSGQVRANRILHEAVVQTQQVVTAAKDGDLLQRIPLDGKSDSIRELCQGVNALVENMATVVGQIKAATEAIGSASGQISVGNADLSARTEQQAASLEETASSMEELTSTVRHNAENARQANQFALGASEVARKGGQVVGDVVTTMSAINESSKKIVDIISVIDGIAFQTNILALNAAVEAARAGEQGRGFAVVAAEVRTLAQRSAGAAKEIKLLIGNSVEKVDNGSRLVEQAGRNMEEIVTSVKRVTDMMAEISAASQEQSVGIEQINQTIVQMDQVTQQNAAMVEQASAAASALLEQAGGLNRAVSRFRVDAGKDLAPAAAPDGAATRVPQAASRPKTPAAATSARRSGIVRIARASAAGNGSIHTNGAVDRPANGSGPTEPQDSRWTEF